MRFKSWLGNSQTLWVDSDIMSEPEKIRWIGQHAPAVWLGCAIVLMVARPVVAEVGDPQIRTDHPWYPGELACSTFERLFATQAEQFRRATGVEPKSDEEKALASWFWRNTHYAHGEEGAEDLWGTGFSTGDLRTREYWTGLFAHGFAGGIARYHAA